MLVLPEPLAVNVKHWQLLAGIVLSIAVLGLLLRLAFWQLERAEYKESLAAQAQENAARGASLPHEILQQARNESWHFRPVTVRGRFDPVHQYLLDNRTFDGQAGYHVLSVLDYGTHHLLVNRGWVSVGSDRRVLPEIPLADQQFNLSGQLVALPGSGLLLGDSGYGQGGWPKVVQRVELEAMNRQLGLVLLPAVLQLDPQHPVCFRCRWPVTKGISAQRHRGYALQWFSLAVTWLVLIGVVSFLGVRRRAR